MIDTTSKKIAAGGRPSSERQQADVATQDPKRLAYNILKQAQTDATAAAMMCYRDRLPKNQGAARKLITDKADEIYTQAAATMIAHRRVPIPAQIKPLPAANTVVDSATIETTARPRIGAQAAEAFKSLATHKDFEPFLSGQAANGALLGEIDEYCRQHHPSMQIPGVVKLRSSDHGLTSEEMDEVRNVMKRDKAAVKHRDYLETNAQGR